MGKDPDHTSPLWIRGGLVRNRSMGVNRPREGELCLVALGENVDVVSPSLGQLSLGLDHIEDSANAKLRAPG